MSHRAIYSALVFGCVFMIAASVADAASVARDVNKANAFYEDGKFDEAARLYENALSQNPNLPEGNYNLGTALYKKGDYNGSIERFQKALLSDNEELVNKAQFNLGNAYYKKSQSLENTDIDAAIDALEKGIGYYDKSSPKAQKDKDFQQNQKVLKDKLEELKKKRKSAKRKGDGDGEMQGNEGPKGEQSAKNGNQDDQSKDGNQNPNSSGDQNNEQKPGDSQNKQSESDGNHQPPDQQNKDQSDQNGQTPNDKPQDQNQQPQQNPGNSPSGGQPQDQQSSAAQAGAHGQMTPQEAQMMLDDYQRNDEPKGMLYFKPESGRSDQVIKDW